MVRFNHIIVAVPALGENRWIDATSKRLGGEMYQAEGFWASRILVVEPAKPRLVKSRPQFTKVEASRVQSKRVDTPDEQNWKVTETLTLTGCCAAWMHRAFSDMTAKQQLGIAQNLLEAHGSATVGSIDFGNLEDLAKPAQISFVYRVAKVIDRDTGKFSISVPLLCEKNYLGKQAVNNPTTPFRWEYPPHFNSDVELDLPTPDNSDSWKQSAVGDFCLWKLSAETEK